MTLVHWFLILLCLPPAFFIAHDLIASWREWLEYNPVLDLDSDE